MGNPSLVTIEITTAMMVFAVTQVGFNTNVTKGKCMAFLTNKENKKEMKQSTFFNTSGHG